MGASVPRSLVEAFYRAYAARDAKTIAKFLDDNVEWTISGPVDVLPFCGTRHGKAAVLDVIERLVPDVFHISHFVPDATLIDGDRVATLNRLWARRSDDGRSISYRFAHFLRFRDGKIVENLSLIDSFNAVEQVLGVALTAQAGAPPQVGDLVAI